MKQKFEKLIIHTDGGSRGNPGPAAIGVVFTDVAGRVLKEYSEFLGSKTNNEAEYAAVLFALRKARALYGRKKLKAMEVELRMDSELVCRQLSGAYKVEEEHLWPLFMKIWNTRFDFPQRTFCHVRREENRAADRLVNEALDREQRRLF